MKLTDKQIAEFETRAKAGEKPMEDMWNEEPEDTGKRGDGWLSINLMVQSFSEGGAVLHLPTLKKIKFSSVPAAQLAAEHLLQKATQGLISPDLFWDDGEVIYTSDEYEAAEMLAHENWGGEDHIDVTIQCGLSLPDRSFRVTRTIDEKYSNPPQCIVFDYHATRLEPSDA